MHAKHLAVELQMEQGRVHEMQVFAVESRYLPYWHSRQTLLLLQVTQPVVEHFTQLLFAAYGPATVLI